MSIFDESVRILTVKESDHGPYYEVRLANGQTRNVLKGTLKFDGHGEDLQTVVWYRGTILSQFIGMGLAFLQEQGINLAEEETPCLGCKGGKCPFYCDRHLKIAELKVVEDKKAIAA